MAKKKATKNDVQLMRDAYGIARVVFNEAATALHALEIYDRIDANSDDDDLGAVTSDLKVTHDFATKLFGDGCTPDVTLELFGMIIDGDLDESDFMANLVETAAQVHEGFGEVAAHDPAVVLGMYTRKFDVDDGADVDEDYND
jgi:hypothetical protein